MASRTTRYRTSCPSCGARDSLYVAEIRYGVLTASGARFDPGALPESVAPSEVLVACGECRKTFTLDELKE